MKSFSDYLAPKIAITFSGLAVVLLGSFILLPGFDYVEIKTMLRIPSEMPEVLFSHLTNTILTRFSINSIGINPYLSAAAIMMLLSGFIPPLRRWRDGTTAQLNMFQAVIIVFALLFVVFQSQTITVFISSFVSPVTGETLLKIHPVLLKIVSFAYYTGGMACCLWIAFKITGYGLLNGILVFVGLSYLLPFLISLWHIMLSFTDYSFELKTDGGMLILTAIFTGGCIWLLKAVRWLEVVPVHTAAEQIPENVTALRLPLRLNYVGVMPFVMGRAVCSLCWLWNFFNEKIVLQIILYGIVTFFFTLFYSAIIINPGNITATLRKNGYMIKNISDAAMLQKTIDKELIRSSLITGVFLAVYLAVDTLVSSRLADTTIAPNLFSIGNMILVAIGLELIRRIKEEKKLHKASTEDGGQSGLQTVCDCETELEGDLIRDILMRNGIVSFKKSVRAISLTGSIGIWEICRPAVPCLTIFRNLGAGSIEVLVRRNDYESAVKVIERVAEEA